MSETPTKLIDMEGNEEEEYDEEEDSEESSSFGLEDLQTMDLESYFMSKFTALQQQSVVNDTADTDSIINSDTETESPGISKENLESEIEILLTDFKQFQKDQNDLIMFDADNGGYSSDDLEDGDNGEEEPCSKDEILVDIDGTSSTSTSQQLPKQLSLLDLDDQSLDDTLKKKTLDTEEEIVSEPKPPDTPQKTKTPGKPKPESSGIAAAIGVSCIKERSKSKLECMLCKSEISRSRNVKIFMQNITSHINGKKHAKHLQKIDVQLKNIDAGKSNRTADNIGDPVTNKNIEKTSSSPTKETATIQSSTSKKTKNGATTVGSPVKGTAAAPKKNDNIGDPVTNKNIEKTSSSPTKETATIQSSTSKKTKNGATTVGSPVKGTAAAPKKNNQTAASPTVGSPVKGTAAAPKKNNQTAPSPTKEAAPSPKKNKKPVTSPTNEAAPKRTNTPAPAVASPTNESVPSPKKTNKTNQGAKKVGTETKPVAKATNVKSKKGADVPKKVYEFKCYICNFEGYGFNYCKVHLQSDGHKDSKKDIEDADPNVKITFVENKKCNTCEKHIYGLHLDFINHTKACKKQEIDPENYEFMCFFCKTNGRGLDYCKLHVASQDHIQNKTKIMRENPKTTFVFVEGDQCLGCRRHIYSLKSVYRKHLDICYKPDSYEKESTAQNKPVIAKRRVPKEKQVVNKTEKENQKKTKQPETRDIVCSEIKTKRKYEKKAKEDPDKNEENPECVIS